MQNRKHPEKNRITVGIDAEMRDYLVDKQTGKVVEGNKPQGEVSTVWSFVWRNNQWMQNLIESDDMEMDYLSEQSVIFAKDDGIAS